MGALDLAAARADGAEVVAHAAAAAHRLRRFGHGRVNARQAVVPAGDRVADGLHEAVHQRRLHAHADRRIDAAGGDEALLLCPQEALVHCLAQFGAFVLCQRAGHARLHGSDGVLASLGVFFAQYVDRYILRGQGPFKHLVVRVHSCPGYGGRPPRRRRRMPLSAKNAQKSLTQAKDWLSAAAP